MRLCYKFVPFAFLGLVLGKRKDSGLEKHAEISTNKLTETNEFLRTRSDVDSTARGTGSKLPDWFGSYSSNTPETQMGSDGRGLKDELICKRSNYLIGDHTAIRSFTIHPHSDLYKVNTNYLGLVVYNVGTCRRAKEKHLRKRCRNLANGAIFLYDSDATSPGGKANYIKDIMARYDSDNDYRGRLHGAMATKSLLAPPQTLKKYGMAFGGFSLMTRKLVLKSDRQAMRQAFRYTGGVSFKSCTLNQENHLSDEKYVNDDCRFNAYEMAIIQEATQAWMMHGVKSNRPILPRPQMLGTPLRFNCNRLETRLRCNREKLNKILGLWKPTKLISWRKRYMRANDRPTAAECAGINSNTILNMATPKQQVALKQKVTHQQKVTPKQKTTLKQKAAPKVGKKKRKKGAIEGM